MRIVQINTVYGSGSVGRIAAELYELAETADYESFFAYGRGGACENIRSYKISNPFDFSVHVLSNFFNGNSGFASKAITRQFLLWLDKVKPDLLHLHNIHGFYIHVEKLFDYIKEKDLPVIWTFHDCWPFTGQCAYFDYAGCQKWKSECNNCALYRKDYPYSLFKDNSTINYRLKKAAFTGVKKMIIVTPSEWLGKLVSESFLKDYPVAVIPNGINLDVFKPLHINNNPVREILGVANIWTARKGLSYFLQLSTVLDPSWRITLVGLTWLQKKSIDRQFGTRIKTFTKTQNVEELVKLYNNASVFVNPTLEDNFPTTNLEALACGTPVITFNTGGSPECLDEGCGIVVEKGNHADLFSAVLSLEKRKLTRSNCRKKALSYDKNNNFQRYIALYDRLLK